MKKALTVVAIMAIVLVVLAKLSGSPAKTKSARTAPAAATVQHNGEKSSENGDYASLLPRESSSQTEPTPTPNPFPSIVSELDTFISSHASPDGYTVKKSASPGYISGEYIIRLVLSEASDANGVAEVIYKEATNDIEIDFSYSDFYGMKVCAPSLIKSVSTAVVDFICDYQNISPSASFTKAVISSFDDAAYSDIIQVGKYSVVYSPSDIYASVLNLIDTEEYMSSFSPKGYSNAGYEEISLKLNSGEKYKITGVVQKCENGKYTNSFATYRCRLLTVKLTKGETITVAQFPDHVPVDFVLGQKYSLYGSPMYDINGNMLFYLDYAE